MVAGGVIRYKSQVKRFLFLSCGFLVCVDYSQIVLWCLIYIYLDTDTDTCILGWIENFKMLFRIRGSLLPRSQPEYKQQDCPGWRGYRNSVQNSTFRGYRYICYLKSILISSSILRNLAAGWAGRENVHDLVHWGRDPPLQGSVGPNSKIWPNTESNT